MPYRAPPNTFDEAFTSLQPLLPLGEEITATGMLGRMHERIVHSRRVKTLCQHFAGLVPPGARLLDVGCGDGWLSRLLQERRSDIRVEGIDVLVREDTQIRVRPFDGRVIPFDDETFDVVLLVDVLHHTTEPAFLLAEATRVTRRYVMLKDHCLTGFLAGATLRFMDDVGNARFGVALPYNYWPRVRWFEAFQGLGLGVDTWRDDLRLYPWPASWLFERKLHFLARLEKRASEIQSRGMRDNRPESSGQP